MNYLPWLLLAGIAAVIIYRVEKEREVEAKLADDWLKGPSSPPDWWKNDPFFTDPEGWRKDLEERINKFKQENPVPPEDQ
jgi:hypothetical protein